MAVDIHALTSVDEVLAYIGDDIQRDALWVYCSQGDATAATVEVTSTTMVLTITGGLEEGPNTLTFADSDKNTLSELITAINALTGWKAGRMYHSDAESTDLIVTGALACLDSENEITLKIKDNFLIEKMIDRATDLIERYCGRLFDTRAYTREIYYGSGFSKLLLEQYPVTRITRLSAGRANSFSIKNTSTDANFCTVEITATKIRLIVDGGTNAYDSNVAPLVLATYTTIDLLITAIHALGKGWVCTTMATDTATRDASELLIRPSMFVDATKQAYCETVDDDITDYKLLKPTEARNEGILYKPGVFSAGMEYFINYQAGYTTIPYVLEQFCIYLVCYVYGKSKRAGDEELKSETFGEGADYKYERISMADFEKARALMPLEIQNGLDLFKKREL